jgi:hypothetical protein
MTTEQRLARLERENRWTKGIAVALALALGVVLFVSAGQEQEKDKPKVLDQVRAKRFLAVDESGVERGVFEANNGGATLILRSKDDSHVLVMTAANTAATTAAAISLLANGHESVGLIATGQGGMLGVSGSAGRQRATICVAATKPAIFLTDSDGKDRFSLMIGELGASLDFIDGQGTSRLNLQAYDDGPSVSLMDKAGRRRAAFGCAMTTHRVTGAETRFPESTLILSDSAGRVLFQAPK